MYSKYSPVEVAVFIPGQLEVDVQVTKGFQQPKDEFYSQLTELNDIFNDENIKAIRNRVWN